MSSNFCMTFLTFSKKHVFYEDFQNVCNVLTWCILERIFNFGSTTICAHLTILNLWKPKKTGGAKKFPTTFDRFLKIGFRGQNRGAGGQKSVFRGNFFEDFYNMQWAQKPIVRRYVVSSSTTKPPNSSALGHRIVENWPRSFCKKIAKNCLNISSWETQNRAHFVRRYLKHAVSSEAVTVAFASMQ